MSESEDIEANIASSTEGQVQLRLEETQAKTPRKTAAKERKLEIFRIELVRTHDNINEMIDNKRRSFRVKSEFEKFLHVVEKYKKKAQEIDAKQGKKHVR